jgi:hypothetical protein
MKESLEILKMKKLAGLLSEGEYAKALCRTIRDGARLHVDRCRGC